MLDTALKPDRPAYGEVLPAHPILTDQEKKENGAFLQRVADKVVHNLEPAPVVPEDDGAYSFRQRLQQQMKRSKFVNDEGGESEAGVIKARDAKTGSVTTYFFVLNHAPDSERVASVEWGAEVTIPGSDSDVPDEEAIVRRVSTKIVRGENGVYTLEQKSERDTNVGPKGHEYGIHKIGHVLATTEPVPPDQLLQRRQVRHRDAFAANANFDELQLAAVNREPFKFKPDGDDNVTILLADTPTGEPVRMPG